MLNNPWMSIVASIATTLLLILTLLSFASNGQAEDLMYLERWSTQQGAFWDAQQWFAGDFNGDGKTDIANVFNENGFASIDVHISDGSSFSYGRWATQQGFFWDAQRWFAGDFN